MRQLARLSDAGVEGLAGLVGAVVTLVAVGFEQVSPPIGKDDGTIIRAEGGGTEQTFPFEVRAGATREVVAAVVEITLGNDAKGADGG